MITKFYPFKIKLKSPVIITTPRGDPNSANCLPYVTGSSIRGALAELFIDNKELFYKIILSGKINFLNCYPYENNARVLPLPASLRKKEEEADNKLISPIDLLGYSCEGNNWPEEQLKELDFHFLTLTRADKYGVKVKTSYNIHHQTNRERGRPIPGEGVIFSYESIDAGQEFAGMLLIRGNDEDHKLLEIIKQEVKNKIKNQLIIGRSKNAQYGGVGEIEWLDSHIREREIELDLFDLNEGEDFIALLTSDYIGRNIDTGHQDPLWIEKELAKKFGDNKIKVVRKRWKFGIAGGFNRKWGLPIPQSITLKAGSVLLLKALKPIKKDELLYIEQQGLGERKIDGFGRIVFLKPKEFNIRSELPHKEPEKQKIPIPETIDKMQERILKEMINRKIKGKAFELGHKVQNIPPSSLLGRLSSYLRGGQESISRLDEFLKALDETNKPAEEKLKKCRLGNENLYRWLKNQINTTKAPEFLYDLCQKYYIKDEEHAKKILNSPEIIQYIKWKYIGEVLRVLSIKARTSSKEGEE